MNHATYLRLLTKSDRNAATSSRDSWYALSEPIFKKQALDDPNDLIRFIAFAYS